MRKGTFSIDYTGQRFGKFTVIEYHSTRRWLCRCDCGIEKVIRIDHLLSGNTVSCGCHRREIGKRMITANGCDRRKLLNPGDRFGRWTVVQADTSNGYYPPRYICQCDCGTVRSVGMRNLVVGDSQSCGCYHKEISSHQARRLFTKHGRCKDPEYLAFLKRRRHHIDRDWTIEMNELLFGSQPSCVICRSMDRLEVDHVVPSIKGGRMEPGNVVVLCRHHNRAKHDHDLSQLPDDWQARIKDAASEFAKVWGKRAAG